MIATNHFQVGLSRLYIRAQSCESGFSGSVTRVPFSRQYSFTQGANLKRYAHARRWLQFLNGFPPWPLVVKKWPFSNFTGVVVYFANSARTCVSRSGGGSSPPHLPNVPTYQASSRSLFGSNRTTRKVRRRNELRKYVSAHRCGLFSV